MSIIIDIDTDNLCSICLTENDKDIKDNLNLIKNCKHRFHYDCIIEWIKVNQTCPMCRQNITKKDDDSNICGCKIEKFLCIFMVINLLVSFSIGLTIYYVV